MRIFVTSRGSIGRRLAGSFGLVVVLLAAVAVASWLALGQARALNEQTMTMVLPAATAISSAESAHLTTAVLVRDSVSNPDLSIQARTRKELREQSMRLDEFLAALGSLMEADDFAGQRDAVKELAEGAGASRKHIAAALELVDRAQYDEAGMLVYNELAPVQAKMSLQLSDLRDQILDQSSRTLQAASARNARSMALVLGGTATAILVAVLASFLITRTITRPIAAAVAAAERVAEGELATVLHTRSRDETGRLLEALERMRGGLAESVGAIRAAAENVGTAARQIAAGNGDLSTRTEEQASSLEETASSMQQLASTVKLNAHHALEADKLAKDASGVAQQGGAAMSQVTETMDGIAKSSRTIGEIVGIIEAIAFQTNILALNAAVEAARAGDQGRGFAVVATEVRSLAQRSAEAAKQIKQIVRESTERVDKGAALVKEAGGTMEAILESVTQVTRIMSDIAGASQEQNAGIQQVSQAITQMEQVTQQNASLVQESAAAAENMKNEAERLVGAVSRFNIHPVEAPAALAPPAPAAHASPSPPPLRLAGASLATGYAEEWRQF